MRTSICKREACEGATLHEEEAAKTRHRGLMEQATIPYYLEQQENVLAESRMMIPEDPEFRNRLVTALFDLKPTLAELELKEPHEHGAEVQEAERTVAGIEDVFTRI
ncbi:tubulin-folding cofactor A-like [Oryza brachyantha]|uniref:tubulin-folding cofactor A-like n=1 Tax=Oryza brachyantha TaxID=4533 RepID=UPI0003EA9D29|nr:tubulin-folding cofactor A-like [Oryza brachyantha]